MGKAVMSGREGRSVADEEWAWEVGKRDRERGWERGKAVWDGAGKRLP
jgi:hypothetical protein